MNKVTLLKEKSFVAKSKEYPKYAKFPFEDFNPPQTVVLDWFDKDVNMGIAAATSAGKTVCGEMFLSHEVRQRGGKGMYVGTHKSLVQEKLDDWTDPEHHFADLNISICSGDYQLTDARKKELAESNLITMTSEMLSSRCRNFKSEKNNFLLELGTIVVDESHLLTVPGRGDHLEVALMKLTEINPDVRIILLSATMPNVKELCEWLTILNGKETYFLNSTFRPCPLDLHYPTYDDSSWKYDAKEDNKVWEAIKLVERYPDDKFLIFAHTKKTGQKMTKELNDIGINASFHNADLSKEKRRKAEQEFKTDKGVRCIVATSTLAWGINMPARRVIVLGVHRGLELVEVYDIKQMVGRAGRPKYDKKGDAYVLLPYKPKDYEEQKRRITEDKDISSQLIEHHKILGFHLVSEIYLGNVSTMEDVHKWYSRSLAAHQAKKLSGSITEECIGALLKCGAIMATPEGYKATAVGKIASLFYYSPFDVADLKRNVTHLFLQQNEDNDFLTSLAIGDVDSQRMNIVSNAEKEALSMYSNVIGQDQGGSYTPSAGSIKAGYAYYCMLNGNPPMIIQGFMRGLQMDFDRLVEVLSAIDTMASKWDRRGWIIKLKKRVQYGVPEYLLALCDIPEVGAVRARTLYSHGIKTPKDLVEDEPFARAILNMKPVTFKKILDGAKTIHTRNMLAG